MPPCSVLLVSAQPALLKMTATFLAEEGYGVRGVSTGREALAELAREAPDVLLLDLHLSDGSSGEIIASVRTRQLPSKILLLAEAGEVRGAARRLQVDGYVSVPFALAGLLRVLERWRPKKAS